MDKNKGYNPQSQIIIEEMNEISKIIHDDLSENILNDEKIDELDFSNKNKIPQREFMKILTFLGLIFGFSIGTIIIVLFIKSIKK